ncbi:hypothetical protein [Desulfobacula sp.]|uniref:hypothetical protein n=1 Tax=Desulfobacula sp. TaxID=2593537 RepID=UPI0025B7C4D5|nr:hypothetical protein [Desulfobacula sp.]MBC2703791.1 hypothetical protein [Desulfobacula sp.]
MGSDLLEQIRKTDVRVLSLGMIAFLALIGPAMIEIYIVDPDLYRTLTVSKLLFLAIGATLPVAILNTLLCFAATKHDKTSQTLPGTPDLNVAAGLFITALIFYIDIGLQFFVGYSFRVFVIVYIVIEFAVISWSFVQIYNTRKTAK